MSTKKHIPQRTCIACGKTTAKRQLVRLVRTANMHVEIDATGKSAGRGAYLCSSPECREAVLKGNRLERALRTSLSPVDRQRLAESMQDQGQGAN